MQVEAQTDELWVQPNQRTIEFSDTKRQTLLKPYSFMDQAKLDSIGHQFQKDVLTAVSEAAVDTTISSGLSPENSVFIRRMAALVSRMAEWSTRDEVSRMSRLDTLKVDFFYLSDFQNVFCEYISHLVTIQRRSRHQGELMPQDGGVDGPYAYAKVRMMLRAIRYMIHQASNTAFFGALQIILQLASKAENFKEMSVETQRQSIAISEDLAGTLELLFQKIGSQKRVFQMICTQQEKWDMGFKKVSNDFQAHCSEIIRDFAAITQLMLFKDGQGAPEHLKLLREQEGCELESRLAKVKRESQLLINNSLEDVRACFSLHALTINLLMGQYFDLVKQQKPLFQKNLDPTKVVKNLIEIISSRDPYFTPKVRVSALKVLQFMSELDTHPEFRYNHIHDNPYFTVMINYFQEYVSMARNFAETLSAGDTDSTQMQVDQGVVDSQETPVFGSQQFLKAFLGFLYAMIGLKTRSMQAQLFPQLVEPLVRLITVMPRGRTYVINLDCQKSALSILKEIIKNGVSFDDPRQLVSFIERLKLELQILREDYNGTSACVPSRADDSEVNSHTMAKRQELIGSCLRFLCVSIVKMDPNQISISQNFVAHSRKILESNIFEECLKDLVFENNRSGGDETKLEQVIDPIFFSCIQLYTYVFNDLHQKIGEYIDSGLLPCILDSLNRRLPIQQDVLIVTLKFMRLLCLNQKGHKILVESNILKKVFVLCRDHRIYNEFVTLQSNRDQLTLLSQLANESQELSDQMMDANVSNLKSVIDQAWQLTEEYLENERVSKEQVGQSAEEIEKRKEFYYKKQNEFEKSVENVCYAFLFQVHEQLDNNSETNIQRSIIKHECLYDVLTQVITTPTICSAASNFLMAFGDLATVIVILKGKTVFENHINWLGGLLHRQLASLQKLLKVERLDKFDPKNLKMLEPMELPDIAEKNPEKLDLVFKRYQMSAEDLLWVTVAKIHAYLDLLLIMETISRSSDRAEMKKVCIDYFLQPEVGRTPDSLRSQVIWLEELLKNFKFCKYLEKLKKKVGSKAELIARFQDRISKVEWKSYAMILEPQNDYEEALNLYYTFEHARSNSFKLEDKSDLVGKMRVVLQPSEEEVPESTLCRKKATFFINRISAIYRREKLFMLGQPNTELCQYSETNSIIYMDCISSIAQKCQKHLGRIQDNSRDTLVEGVDLEMIEIKLQLGMLHDLGQLLLSQSKIARSASMAMFLLNLLEQGLIGRLFTIVDWACKVLLAYDKPDHPCSKLQLHQQVLHESLITPMSILSYLISGEFLKRDQLKYYLSPNELNVGIAVAKLKLALMSQLFQPMVDFFLKRETQDQFLVIADQFNKDFSMLLEGIIGVLAANAFFGSGSAFDPEYIKPLLGMFESVAREKQENPNGGGSSDPVSQHCQQLMDMGFGERDVKVALQMNGRDFERALDYLIHLNGQRDSSQQQVPASEESKQQQQTTMIETTKPTESKKETTSLNQRSMQKSLGETVDPSNTMMQVGDAKEIEAANQLEFQQRRIQTIKVVVDALILILPSRLVNATLADRDRIFNSFLFQIKKEDDVKVKESLVCAIIGLIRTLVAKVSEQMEESAPDYDWLLLNAIKWCMASDQITLPQEFSFSSIADTISEQLTKKIMKLGSLTTYEKPSCKDLSENETKRIEAEHRVKVHEIQFVLFNTSHLVRAITNVCEEIRTGLRLSNLKEMVADAGKQSKQPDLVDLTRILSDLEVRFRTSDSKYFSAETASSMQIDTGLNQGNTRALQSHNFVIDQTKAATHLQAYFNCMQLFFKELGSVSGFFHQEFGLYIIPLVNKGLKCLSMMAQVGQVGSFDFAKSFSQKNLLRVLLQAKVLDKDFAVDPDAWRFPLKTELNKSDFVGSHQHQFSLREFRSLIKEVSNPKKEQVKQFELSIKAQLYVQFRQNFRRGEKVDFYDYLQTLGGSTSKRHMDSPGMLTGAPIASRNKTKVKEQSASKDSVFTKPTRPSNRSKSQEKGNSQNQQGSKQRGNTQVGKDLQQVPNKVLKKLLVKHDDYNLSTLEDFIAFHKQNLGDMFVQQNQSFLQACARVCLIKEVEVDPKDKKPSAGLEPRSKTKVRVLIKDKTVTDSAAVNNILTTVYGGVKSLIEESDGTLIATLKNEESVNKALKSKQITMALKDVHTIDFKEVTEKPSAKQEEVKGEPVKQLHIMLKRQVLKEMIFDTDFNQMVNYQFIGQPVGTSRENIQSAYYASKTQNEIVNTLLETLVEQTKGIKMDILKIIRNPMAFIKADQDAEASFQVGETVLKITAPEECKSHEEAKHQVPPRFTIDTEKSKSVSKQYFIDYAGILNALLSLLEGHPGTIETVLKHNEGKTLKFILRNIFYLASIHIDGKNGNQVVLKNMQSYNSQRLPDRLNIITVFLTRISICRVQTSLKTQLVNQEVQKALVSIMAKGLIIPPRQQTKQQIASPQVAQACAQLTESTRLVSQYNTVWILTQFLFYKPKQASMNKPIEAVVNNAHKLEETHKLHIVKLFLIEAQLLHQKTSCGPNQDQTFSKNASHLAFLSHIKRLLDNLEESTFLFSKAKVPCMHMCIWAVTSVLKIFEHKPELFIQIRGPPPPPSDSDSDLSVNEFTDSQKGLAPGDQEMMSDGGGVQGPDATGQRLGFASDDEDGDDVDDEEEEEGEEDMSESDSYGSVADLEGNEDLSSNRDNQSFADTDMMQDGMNDDEDDIDDFEDDSYDSIDDYDDEDSSALIQIIPQAVAQNTSAKGPQVPGNDNQNNEFEIIIEDNNDDNRAGNQAEGGFVQVPSNGENSGGGPNDGQEGEEESYYSGEEEESYEPRMTYDNENDSVLSFDSNEDRDNMMHADGGYDQMDQYEDFDGLDNSGASASDNESDSLMHNHHHHHHNHGGNSHSFPPNLAHLPLNQQLWRQITATDQEPLVSKLSAQTQALNDIMESVATSIWPFTVFIPITAQNGSSVEPSSVNQGQNGSEPASSVLRDEQGDEIVIIDPQKFKDKTTIQPAQKQSQPQQPQQKSTLDIEGMDPLFLESLSPQGLQNIADSHQIQNTVVNSANQISRDPSNLQQAQSRYENILQVVREHPAAVQGDLLSTVQSQMTRRQLPTHVNSQNLDQVISVIQQAVGPDPDSGARPSANRGQGMAAQQSAQQPDSRTRFMSIDTVAVSMLGPNDQSRQIQADRSQDAANQERKREPEKNKVHIRGTQYMQNQFQDISDQIAKLTKIPNVAQIDRQCTEIIKQHLLPQESDSIEDKYTKTHDCMQMALVGFKIFEKNDLQIQSRIRLLFLIPSLRTTLIFRVLKLLNTEVANLVRHRDDCLAKNEFSPYKSAEKMPFIVDREAHIVLQEMPLDQMISVALSIIEQLQECLQLLGLERASQQQSAEISKIISSDETLAKYAELSDLDACQLNQSIIQSMLGSLYVYFTTVKSDPWVLPLDQSQPQFKTALVNSVLASLRKILQPLSNISMLPLPVEKICELIVAPDFLKLNKQGHQHVRKILNDITEKENVKLIGNYLEGRLENGMKAIIEMLSAKRTALVDKEAQEINLSSNSKFLGLLDETKELLKLSGGVTKIKAENICRQETLAQLFSVSNAILLREQTKAELESQPNAGVAKPPTDAACSSSYAFMYRNDIKEMILILFALCDYNLRIVFSQPQPLQPSTQEATTTLTQSQEKKDREQEETKGTVLIETTQLRRQSSAPDQEMLEDNSQNEVLKAIETQIAAQWQANSQVGTDADISEQQQKQKFQLDHRLRSIIGFFISNKKLINVFIRVNQQVVNVQLKNLVIKIPQILEFDTKRLIWRIMLKKLRQKLKGGHWDIQIRREQAFEDSFMLMRRSKTDEWKMPLRITFQGEAGVDEGGLTKEWFTLLSKHMFDENMALFLKASTGSTYFPNPKSTVQVDHLDLFEFIGKFVGKALLEQQLLECYFVKAFYKLILEMPLDIADLEDYDQELYKSLTWILQNSGTEHLCSYFVETQDYFGESKDTPLCEGGAERLVTDSNKEEYVKLVANYRLKQAIKSQMDNFMQGLFSVVPKDLIKIFDNRELELLISGLSVVDIDDLRENTTYEGGYSASSKPILLFWEALREFDNSERAEFIQFVTGSSKVPIEGFKGLRGQNGIQKFNIAMVHSTQQSRLPQSHTCINQLDLPQYRDKETMKRMLLMASKEGKTFAIA